MTQRQRRGCLEICVESSSGVAAAIAGGADRIELCSALAVGGLTPSAGLVDSARTASQGADVALFAMVRPRAGDFAYDTSDLALAVAEAGHLIAQGVDGLVFGAVRDGQVDRQASRRWIDSVRDTAGCHLPCTFHRAVDLVDDPVEAVATIAALGFDHILTSGGARSAPEGVATIRAMVAQADTVQIMAGAGITPANAAALLEDGAVNALHASAGIAEPTADPRLIALGFAPGPMRRTDVTIVSMLRSVLDNRFDIGH